jgi:hypothetical protein
MRATATALLLALFAAAPLQAQDGPWSFLPDQTITFAEADSMASPYLAALDAEGSLWVISSAEERVYTNLAINALYRARPGERTFTRVFDFTQAGVRSTTGITTVGDDVYVSARMQNPANSVDPYWPQTGIFRFVEGGTAELQFFTDETHTDYGSWFTGIAATPEGMLYAGRSWRPTITTYDFRPGSETFGNSTVPAGDNSQAFDPFGELEPNGTSYIRAVALIPGADYSNPATPVYTSRNASMFEDTAPQVGGVGVWSGGTQADPSSYRAQRVFDPGGTMDFGPRHPNGIALDFAGLLYVANSTDRWAKAFEMVGPLAFEVYDLPSATTTRAGEQNSGGAPFEEPSGIAVDADRRHVWVLDRRAQAAFFFENLTTSSAEAGTGRGEAVRLEASYPNPFTEGARLKFHLAEASEVRLAVYDVLGREVAVLAEGMHPAGSHPVWLDGRALPAGLYLYRIVTPQGSASQTATRLR